MPNIVYLHGFASIFDTRSSKIQGLGKLGKVSGCNLDYTRPVGEVVDRALRCLANSRAELLVGTSMGGWLASITGSLTRTPFVAINPVTDPAQTLSGFVGPGVDHQGRAYHLKASTVAGYYPMATDGKGLILLDDGDEQLDAQQTAMKMEPHYRVQVFPGGHHRFAHMDEALPTIATFLSEGYVD